MTYDEFLAINAYSLTIDKVSYRRNFLFLPNNRGGMSIDTVVKFVMQGQFYLSNPSKIRRWKGFIK